MNLVVLTVVVAGPFGGWLLGGASAGSSQAMG